jgi:hypothetical protein
VLESLDAVLEEVLEGVLLVLLVLVESFLVFGGAFPEAVGGGSETCGEGFPLGLDLVIIADGRLLDEVPDPLLDVVDELTGVLFLKCAPLVGLSLGVFKECSDVVLEVMVLDLADFHLDSLVCACYGSFFLQEASFDFCSGGSKLVRHDFVTEVNELGNGYWAVLTVVFVELHQHCIDVVGKECFFLSIILLLLIVSDRILHLFKFLLGAFKFPVELFDGIFKIALDSLLVLLTGGSVEFLHHEANFSEDLSLTLVHLQLKVLSLVCVLLLCIFLVLLSF